MNQAEPVAAPDRVANSRRDVTAPRRPVSLLFGVGGRVAGHVPHLACRDPSWGSCTGIGQLAAGCLTPPGGPGTLAGVARRVSRERPAEIGHLGSWGPLPAELG